MSTQTLSQAVRRDIDEINALIDSDQALLAVHEARKRFDALNRYHGRYADVKRRAMRTLHDDFGWSLSQIGKEFGLSRQRVCQIIKK